MAGSVETAVHLLYQTVYCSDPNHILISMYLDHTLFLFYCFFLLLPDVFGSKWDLQSSKD